MREAQTRPSPARAAIVDDDEVLRTEVQQTIERVGGLVVIGSVASVRDALVLARQRPDLFFIDLSLPDGSGFEVISHLREAGIDCRTIVLSVFGDAENVVRAIELGADGYLLKGAQADEAAWAIHTVLEGGAPLSPSVAGHILRRVRANAARGPSTGSGLKTPLTQREMDTLEGLAKGLSFKELAPMLNISHHTVGDHVKAIYRKLEVNSRAEAIFEAAQRGLIRIHE
jgi:DNA-binding NarL/FixJ family response regulator